MRKLMFRCNGRQATKDDLLDILQAIDPNTRGESLASWTVDTLRAALVFAVDRCIEREAVAKIDAADRERAESGMGTTPRRAGR